MYKMHKHEGDLRPGVVQNDERPGPQLVMTNRAANKKRIF